MVKKEQISLRLPKETKEKLEKLADATNRDKTFLATEAINQYCDLHEWQVEAVKQGMQDIKNGNYVTHEEIKQEWISKREDYLGKVG